MKGPIALVMASVLVLCTASFSFALSISTSTYGDVINYAQYGYSQYADYRFADYKTANSGAIFSYTDQNSTSYHIDSNPPGPLVTDIQGHSSATAFSSGLLVVNSQVGKPLGANVDNASFSAEASWQNSFTNNGSYGQNYYLDLAVSPIDLFLSFWPEGEAAQASATYGINVLLNGDLIWSDTNRLLIDLNPIYGQIYDPTNDTKSLSIPAINYNIPLGLYDPDEIFTLEYQAFSRSWIDDVYEKKASVSPFSVSGQVVAAAPVPEPASLLLLGAGLVGLAGLKRKVFSKSL